VMFIVFNRKKLIFVLLPVVLILLSIISYCVLNQALSDKLKLTSENDSGYLVMIYIEEKKLYLFKHNNCIKEYPIASGKRESPSPIGVWEIVEKKDWGEGFGGYWLGLNVLWGKYGIHGTTRESSIGHAVSHGCIRMLSKDIKELYNIVSIGTPVVIRDGDYGPFGTGFRRLKPGDRGADVLAVQQRLKALGYYKGKENGIYEDDLKQALYSFQKDNNLKVKYTITYEDYIAMGFDEFE
jgi:hypothetical protein